MIKKISARAAVVALMLGASQAATAITVFNNGVPNLVSGTAMTEFVVADNFTVASSFDITNIRFWSAQDAPGAYQGSVAWAIYSDLAGLPNSSLNAGLATVAGTASGGSTGFLYGIYSFDIPVTFTLAAGNYWLALHNGPLSNTTTAGDMLWATSGTGSGPASIYNNGGWIDSGNELAFRVDGNVSVVPEPEGVALFLAGLAVCGGLRKKRPPLAAQQ